MTTNNNNQMELPLFPPEVEGRASLHFRAKPGIMEKVKEGHLLNEIEKLKRENSHLKHQKAGHIGAYEKLKKNAGKTADNEGSTEGN